MHACKPALGVSNDKTSQRKLDNARSRDAGTDTVQSHKCWLMQSQTCLISSVKAKEKHAHLHLHTEAACQNLQVSWPVSQGNACDC